MFGSEKLITSSVVRVFYKTELLFSTFQCAQFSDMKILALVKSDTDPHWKITVSHTFFKLLHI